MRAGTGGSGLQARSLRAHRCQARTAPWRLLAYGVSCRARAKDVRYAKEAIRPVATFRASENVAACLALCAIHAGPPLPGLAGGPRLGFTVYGARETSAPS